MLINLKDILQYAVEGNYAIGAFNTPTFEAIRAVIEGAEELNAPVIIAHAQVHEQFVPMEMILPAMLNAAEAASVPVCVHLDHGGDFDYVVKGMKAGFTSVMIDYSSHIYEINVETTKKTVDFARTLNISVEAEIGMMAQIEGGSYFSEKPDNPEDLYTNPRTAAEFAESTGVDALAVSFGTAHGIYSEKPCLDIKRLNEIYQLVSVPLVMHGGSGLSCTDFRNVIDNGVRKINYYTYMGRAGADAVRMMMDKTKGTYLFHDIAQWGREAMKKDAVNAMLTFNGKRESV